MNCVVCDKPLSKYGEVPDVLMVIYDTETNKYRLLVYEEDGVLRILAAEPVVLVTEEDDLVASHKRSAARELDNYLERKQI